MHVAMVLASASAGHISHPHFLYNGTFFQLERGQGDQRREKSGGRETTEPALSGGSVFFHGNLIIVKLKELTFIEHLLCTKHHIKYFTFNLHNNPKIQQPKDDFAIEETGLERLDELPEVSQLVNVRPALRS